MQRALNRVQEGIAPDGHLSVCIHTPSVFVLRGARLALRGCGLCV